MNANQPPEQLQKNTMDLTISWASAVPKLMNALRDGNQFDRTIARLELMRMAVAADLCFGAVRVLTDSIDREHASPTDRLAIAALLDRVHSVAHPGDYGLTDAT
jgi:hypothetical protein